MSTVANINTEIIPWAIARAGHEVPAFLEANPRVQEWLEGEKIPTERQLEAFSKKVFLPFGYLFLLEPPKEKLPIPYFRSNGDKVDKVSINIYDTILQNSWFRKRPSNKRGPIVIVPSFSHGNLKSVK